MQSFQTAFGLQQLRTEPPIGAVVKKAEQPMQPAEIALGRQRLRSEPPIGAVAQGH
jgi:hypothetical protein